MWSARSWTRTDHPRCARAAAATSPAMPPPAISAWPPGLAHPLLLLDGAEHHGGGRLVGRRLPVQHRAADAVDVHAVEQEEPRRLVVGELAGLAVELRRARAGSRVRAGLVDERDRSRDCSSARSAGRCAGAGRGCRRRPRCPPSRACTSARGPSGHLPTYAPHSWVTTCVRTPIFRAARRWPR